MNYYELEPENNHFRSLFVDLTHRCNMNCANCYVPNRQIPDMPKKPLFELLKKLPFRCQIRLIGAEPTLRKDLPEIISEVKRLRHHPVLLTNGLKLASEDYTRSLKQAGLFFVHLSLNGADEDAIYKKMDGAACANRKIKALENLAKMNFFIHASSILLKGTNERVPKRLYQILKNLKVRKAVMRFRNIGQIGRYMAEKEDNYSFKELVSLMAKEFGLSESFILKNNKIGGFKEPNIVFFPLIKSKTQEIYVKITDWSPENSNLPDPESRHRGRVTQDFKLAPFFEHVKQNEFGY